MASVIAAAARENVSFAGPFAYEQQIPMKSFLGQQPLVPIKPLMEALDSMQHGEASPKHKRVAHDALKHRPHSQKHADCERRISACNAIAGDKQREACMQKAASSCLSV